MEDRQHEEVHECNHEAEVSLANSAESVVLNTPVDERHAVVEALHDQEWQQAE